MSAGDVGTVTIDGNGIVFLTGSIHADKLSAGTDPNNSNDYYFLVITPGFGTVLQDYLKTQVHGVRVVADPQNLTPAAGDDDLINLGGTLFPGSVGIQGGAGSDLIIASDGDDAIFGGTGANVIYGGPGSDTISDEGANSTLRAGTGDDVVFSNLGNNVLVGALGNDQLISNTGNDTLRGSGGNNTLNAGTGDDLLLGGLGNNFLEGGVGRDTLIGGSGNNTLLGGTGDSYLAGNWENFLPYQGDNLNLPGNGSDSITGNGANDTIASNGGNDTITANGAGTYYAVNNPSAQFVNSQPGIGTSENDILSGAATQTITINLTIRVVQQDGTLRTVDIPSGAGSSPNGTSVARTTDANGTVVFQSSGARTFTLGDFFHHWAVNFSPVGVGRFTTRGGGHSYSMTVNGIANSLFDAYPVVDGDTIVVMFHI